MDPVATTDRLTLREWGEGDEARFYAAMNTPAVMRWLGGVQTPAQWHEAYLRLVDYQRDLGHTFWLVERRTDGDLLGFCGLKRVNAPGALMPGAMEIGWRLREAAWGQGFAKEAAIASMDLAFGHFSAPFVVAPTARANLPSQGLMRRIGMERRPEFDFTDTRFPADSVVNPQIVHSIDLSDWPAARERALL